jgi:hypothetical protein
MSSYDNCHRLILLFACIFCAFSGSSCQKVHTNYQDEYQFLAQCGSGTVARTDPYFTVTGSDGKRLMAKDLEILDLSGRAPSTPLAVSERGCIKRPATGTYIIRARHKEWALIFDAAHSRDTTELGLKDFYNEDLSVKCDENAPQSVAGTVSLNDLLIKKISPDLAPLYQLSYHLRNASGTELGAKTLALADVTREVRPFLELDEEGLYQLTVTIRNRLRSDKTQTCQFNLDQTAPLFEAGLKPNNLMVARYKYAAQDVYKLDGQINDLQSLIELKPKNEANLAYQYCFAPIVADAAPASQSEPCLSRQALDYSPDQPITLPKEGFYQLYFKATDQAGNSSSWLKIGNFLVFHTPGVDRYLDLLFYCGDDSQIERSYIKIADDRGREFSANKLAVTWVTGERQTDVTSQLTKLGCIQTPPAGHLVVRSQDDAPKLAAIFEASQQVTDRSTLMLKEIPGATLSFHALPRVSGNHRLNLQQFIAQSEAQYAKGHLVSIKVISRSDALISFEKNNLAVSDLSEITLPESWREGEYDLELTDHDLLTGEPRVTRSVLDLDLTPPASTLALSGRTDYGRIKLHKSWVIRADETEPVSFISDAADIQRITYCMDRIDPDFSDGSKKREDLDKLTEWKTLMNKAKRGCDTHEEAVIGLGEPLSFNNQENKSNAWIVTYRAFDAAGNSTPWKSAALLFYYALGPQVTGTASQGGLLSENCNNVDFGTYTYRPAPENDSQVIIDSYVKTINTVGTWFYTMSGISGPRKLDGTECSSVDGTSCFRTGQLRVHRKIYEQGCKAILNARKNVLFNVSAPHEPPGSVQHVQSISAMPATFDVSLPDFTTHIMGLAIDINKDAAEAGGRIEDPPNSAHPNAVLWREVFSKFGFSWGNDLTDRGPAHFEIPVIEKYTFKKQLDQTLREITLSRESSTNRCTAVVVEKRPGEDEKIRQVDGSTQLEFNPTTRKLDKIVCAPASHAADSFALTIIRNGNHPFFTASLQKMDASESYEVANDLRMN